MDMTYEEQTITLVQVTLAALLSMIVGWERESRDKAAGLRTHMLVGVGACLFTALSLFAFPRSETARVAAQVVTGVGFLGAGIIFRPQNEDRIKNLTTAASIWTTAGVGMAVGVGAWILAAGVTLIVWTILRLLWLLSRAER